MASVRNAGFSVLGLVILVSIMACGGSGSSATIAPEELSTLLFEKVVDLPSKKVNVAVFHVKLPVGFITPAHTHEGPGPRYLIEGTTEIVIGETTETYTAGEAFWEPGDLMTDENVGDVPVELIAVRLLPVEPEPAPAAGDSNISTLLFEKVVDLPSNKVNVAVFRVKLPVGFITPAHTHKGPGPRYLIEGTTEIVIGETTETFMAGEAFWEPGDLMTGENVGDVPVELIAVRLLPVE